MAMIIEEQSENINLTVDGAVQSASFATANCSPWKEFLESNTGTTNASGRDFLLHWGISPRIHSIDSHIESLQSQELQQFAFKWLAVEIGCDTMESDLLNFYQDLDEEVRQILPEHFITKARMVWSVLHLFPDSTGWSKKEFEVKRYSIWHHFFAEYYQVSAKKMGCIPPGGKFADVRFTPSLLISVCTSSETSPTQSHLVPAVILQNAVADAPFDKHEDTTTVLTETRTATTFSLSTFDTFDTYCYGVVNGGSYMSVTLMRALMSKKHERLYTSAFIKGESEEATNYTIKYSLENYKEIILLFVAIHLNIRSMAKYKQRAKPLAFISTKFTPVRKVVVPPKAKPSPSKENTSVAPSQTNPHYPRQRSTGTLTIGEDKFRVYECSPTIRALEHGDTTLVAKVMPLGEDGSLPTEYQMLMKLDHPNIIKPINMIRDDDENECWVIFNGYSEVSMLRRCAYDNANMTLGVLQALNYLHIRGIVHADVKSANVMASCHPGWSCRRTWSQDFKPYLIDFGLAFDLDNNPNDCRGTRPFLAPEVNEGNLSPAMDMWAYGLYVFDTFFGFRNIVQESSEEELLGEIELKQKALPEYLIVRLLFDLIWRCLVSDPEDRITSEQALKHPFFYAMKHVTPSYITMYVLGNFLNLDGDSPDDLTEEQKSVQLPSD